MSTAMATKPLGAKAYGSIPHLIGSRAGPGDHFISAGQHRMCTDPKYRTKSGRRPVVYVQEKLDGSCCAVARVGGELHALSRGGWVATTSPYEQHRLFAEWVDRHRDRFLSMLLPGERAVGEWLAQAHGTRYQLPHEPFVVFDLMRGAERAPFWTTHHRATGHGFKTPRLIAMGDGFPIEDVMALLGSQLHEHGAVDPPEGAIWRLETRGRRLRAGDASVEFLAKYVRPDFDPGRYLPEISGGEPVWNWRP